MIALVTFQMFNSHTEPLSTVLDKIGLDISEKQLTNIHREILSVRRCAHDATFVIVGNPYNLGPPVFTLFPYDPFTMQLTRLIF